jgi:hypothetical protein
MRIRSDNSRVFFFVRLTILLLGVIAVQSGLLLAQTQGERFWLAGRYDGNRIIVYFDAVQFNGTIPPQAEKLVCPIAVGFFCPVKLPASYIAQFQKGPNMEHFALGDKYDVVQDGSSILTVTVTTLVGFESDEGVGNDSFIGALATLEKDKQDWLMYYTPGYLAVRRHRELAGGAGKDQERIRTVFACLLNEPIRFDMQTQIIALLSQRMKTMATDTQRHEAESVSPLFAVQQFRLADGTQRYYARAAWKSGKGSQEKLIYGLGAWIAPLPTLHLLAVESGAGFEYLPDLLNVIDLGGGNAGIIVSEHGDESASLSLVEYRDGMDLRHMRTLQSIGSGE